MISPRFLPASMLLLLLLAGCGSRSKLPVYDDEQGFHFTPPPGWSERARPAVGAADAAKRGKNLPLPPLGVPAGVGEERLLVRYDRPSSGRSAWIRITAADAPPALSLADCLSARAPGADWRAESKAEDLQVGGQPAARLAFTGRWSEQDYRCEIVAARKGGRTYFIAASFPASDATARAQVRKAIAEAKWR
jgi:hypothetical protein